ncbi:MAG TPA: hypothetical protein VMF65_11120 [Acidimicrobiales bacterium]|nr:hypothetical protein [Acidimicrobiales bacterium]
MHVPSPLRLPVEPVWVDPAQHLTVLFFTQVLGAVGDLGRELRRLVYPALVS